MKRLLQTLLLNAVIISAANAQNFTLLESTAETIRVKHSLSANLLETGLSVSKSIGANEYLDFSASYEIVSMNLGQPALPFFTESVIVSNTGSTSLTISHDGYDEYENILVAPSKGSLKRNISPQAVPYLFGDAYTTDAFFPGNLASLSSPFILRSTRGATITINPYQYNPVTKKLRVYKNIQVTVNVNLGETGENELTPRLENSETFYQAYKNLYLNPSALGRYSPRDEEGEMLIIAPNAFIDEMEPFAQWKTEKGIKTTLVSKSDAGGTAPEIKSYIEDFYGDNPDLVFVVLVGDHEQLPCFSYGESGGEQLWSDSYFGQMTGDYYPELFVGRFSGNASEIETMVERTLEYEKDPAAGDWMTKAIGLASDEGYGYGDDGEADWQHARTNRAKYLDFGYTTIYEFYDGSQGGADAPGNPNAEMISPVVNSGIGLFNYTGHGDLYTCVTGNFNSDDVDDATNNGKYPFVISVACNNGTFVGGTCISETWLRATNGSSPSGAIAACGSSILMAWAEPMQTQDEMSEIITEAYVSNRKATLGGIFYNAQMSMFEDYGASVTAREVMQTWMMFGDPSTLFRNKMTEDMTVTHLASVPMGTTSVNVSCDVEDATVAISQAGVLLGFEKVVGGLAAITFPAIASSEPLLVTATKQNYRPYQGPIAITNSDVSADEFEHSTLVIYPNPANDFVTINWMNAETPSRVELWDATGKLILSENQFSGNFVELNLSGLAPGVFILKVESLNGMQMSKFIVQ
jgi:gingipain R